VDLNTATSDLFSIMVDKAKKTPDIAKALGLAIRELRSKIPMSQEELAHRADLDRGYMGAVERGAYNLTIKNIAKVSAALEIKPSALLKTAEKFWSEKENF
jgi:transcriptional regulator with XRE-family HTH domain